jgi:hypothetical protein
MRTSMSFSLGFQFIELLASRYLFRRID